MFVRVIDIERSEFAIENARLHLRVEEVALRVDDYFSGHDSTFAVGRSVEEDLPHLLRDGFVAVLHLCDAGVDLLSIHARASLGADLLDDL